MRIVQVLLRPGIGGMETFAAALSGELSARGIANETVYLDSDERGGRVGRIWRLRATLAKIAPTAVISHSMLPNVYTRIAAPKHLRLVTVLHSSADDYRSRRIAVAERLLARRSSAIVAVSEQVRGAYVQRYNWTAPKVVVIPNGIAVPALAPKTSNAVPTGLFLGRIVRGKGLHTLVEALNHPESPRNLRILVAGPDTDPVYARECKYAAEPLVSQGRLAFLGPSETPGTLLQQADFVVHPSVAEAQDLTLLEASLYGLPSIVTDRVASTLDNRLVVQPFKAEDQRGLAEALRSVVEDLDHLTSRARQLAPEVERCYSISRACDSYLSLLDSSSRHHAGQC